MVESSRTFPSDLGQLTAMREFLDTACRSAWAVEVDDEALCELEVATQEAVTNIIRHGYGGREDGEIRIGFHVTPEAITVTVEDDAPPFDPHERPDPPLPPEGGDASGVGVYLIKRVMDEVDYRRNGSCNVLTLTKRTGRATCR